MKISWLVLALIPATLGARDDAQLARHHLLRSSCDYFGESGYQPASSTPWVKPVELTLYRDGTMIFEKDGVFREGMVAPKDLKRIKKRLGKSNLLGLTAGFDDLPGEGLLMHGGVCYLTHSDGDSRFLVAATVLPTKGEWARLLKALRRGIPQASKVYIPPNIRIRVTPVNENNLPPWLHAASLDLDRASLAPSIEVTDAQLLRFLFTHSPAGAIWRFNQGGSSFKITLLEVPGWYEPLEFEKELWGISGQLGLPQ